MYTFCRQTGAKGLRSDSPARRSCPKPSAQLSPATTPETRNPTPETCFSGRFAKIDCETVQPLNQSRFNRLRAKFNSDTGAVSQYDLATITK